MQYRKMNMSTQHNQCIDVTKRILGSWRLPETKYGTAIASFMADGMFLWHYSSIDRSLKAQEIAIGSCRRGNWHIRTNRLGAFLNTSLPSFAQPMLGAVWNRAWSIEDTFVDSKQLRDCEGLFLILNFTALPESCLNLNLLGLRMDVANWVMNLFEMVGNPCHELLSVSTSQLQIRYDGKEATWNKIS